jgi:Tol biopolymer transport system component
MEMKKIIFFLILLGIFTDSAHAQYWSVWQKTHNITLGLSSDEKWAFFIQKNDAGVDNIYKIELKTNAVTSVTNFTERPVLSGIVLFGKPAVVYSRAASTKDDDIHLYRINVLTTDPPVDFTSKDGTSSKKILGMAYNGRYVYYLSDRGSGSKTDTYRYDAAQYITELAFANDKDYETLCWSRDQTHLFLRDPRSGDFYKYSIETTERQKTDVLDKDFMGNDKINYSLSKKYIHIPGNEEAIIETATLKDPISRQPLPTGAYDLMISPKETSVLFVNKDAGKEKLYLYDIAKKNSKELTTIK